LRGTYQVRRMTELMTSQLRAATITPPGMETFPEGPEKPWGIEGAGCRSIRGLMSLGCVRLLRNRAYLRGIAESTVTGTWSGEGFDTRRTERSRTRQHWVTQVTTTNGISSTLVGPTIAFQTKPRSPTGTRVPRADLRLVWYIQTYGLRARPRDF